MNGTYTFDLDDVSLTNGLTLTFYAEGLAIGNQKINLNLLNADGVTIAKDRINISVEELVWPFATSSEQDASEEPWYEDIAGEWDGLKLGDAWWIEKTLCEIVNTPEDKGEIATIHPDTTTAHEARGTSVPGRTNNDGELSISRQEYPDGFRADIEYEFVHRGNNGYVQAVTKGGKLSFVGNSGLKFGSNPSNGGNPYEVAILDVDALFAEAGGETVLENATGDTGQVDVTVPNYVAEPVHRLMTAVIYGGDYAKMLDNPDYDTEPSETSDPDNAAEYYATHLSNKNRTDGNMVIDLRKVSGTTTTWSLVVELDGSETYRDDNFDPGSLDKLSLQSHWGSGVRFKSFAVTGY